MQIAIVGAGVVGHSLAEQLSQEGHRVSVVDRDRAKIRALSEKADVLAIHGNAGMPSVLRRAGFQEAKMAIAVTDVDEVNLVVGMVAKRLGVEHTIVRIRNPEYLDDQSVLPLDELGIEQVINPDPAIVDTLVRTIEVPGTFHVATLSGGQLVILGVRVPEGSPAAGLTMAELRAIGSVEAFLVLDITRGEQVIVPKGSDRLEPGDTVHILASAKTVQLVPPILYGKPQIVDVVIIAGATRIGVQLGRALGHRVERVVLIEPDPAAAEEAAAELPKVSVLQGDPTDLDLLEEASLDRCDLFCAVTEDDQVNTMSALLARKHSDTYAAVLVKQPEYVPVLHSLGMQLVINPRLATVGEILRYVRRGHVQSVTRLAHGPAEILEMEADEGSPALKAPLKALKFPTHALLGAIVHNGVMRIPTGDSQIQAGDTVVVFALPDAIPRIEKLFTRRRWF